MYEKLNFINGQAPALNAENLNHMDDGIYSAHEEIEQVKEGYLADKQGSVGIENLAAEIIVLLNSIADKADTQTVNENLQSIISALQGKANTSDVSNALSTKANKTDVENALKTKADLDDVYTDDEADEHFLSKYDASQTYQTIAEAGTEISQLNKGLNTLDELLTEEEQITDYYDCEDVMTYENRTVYKYNGKIKFADGNGYNVLLVKLSSNETHLKVYCSWGNDEIYTAGYFCTDENDIIISQYNNTSGKGWLEFDIPEGATRIYVRGASGLIPQAKAYYGKTFLKSKSYTKEEANNKYNPLPLCDLSLFSEIGVIGDSFASGELYYKNKYVDKYNISWGQILARKHGITCTNFSAGGLTTRTWLPHSKGLTLLNSENAKDLYILALGINDHDKLGMSYIGTVDDINDSDYTKNADTFYGNYGKIISKIKEHAPNAKIVISTMANNSDDSHIAYNNAIKGIAKHFGIPYIVQSDDLFFKTSIYKNMSGGHPRAIAYSGMACAMERLLNNCFINETLYFNDTFMYD